MHVIAERDFVIEDQERFAAASGDRNPIHMDAVAARRTMAGYPVVHGVHPLLWALDSVFHRRPNPPEIASIKASFEKMIYVGDHVRAVLVQEDDRRLSVELIVGGTMVTRLDIAHGTPRPSDPSIEKGTRYSQRTRPF